MRACVRACVLIVIVSHTRTCTRTHAHTCAQGKAALLLKPYQLQGVQWMATLYANNLSGALTPDREGGGPERESERARDWG